MTNRLRQLAAATVVLLAPVLAAGAALLLGDDVPDPLPTHWNLAGEVDGTTSLTAFTLSVSILVALASAAALALVARAGRDSVRAAGAAAAAWLAWLPAVLLGVTLAVSVGASTAAEVDLPLVVVLLSMAVPVLAAVLVHRLLPTSGAQDSASTTVPASSLALSDEERVVWVGGASSRRLVAVSVVLAVLALPLWFAAWPAAVAASVAAASVAWIHAVTVRVDDSEVTVSWGPALWPRVRVGLDRVTGAVAEDVEPLRWGGWGYRRTPRGRAAVVRRGPGLVLSLRDGQRFAVTVDRPEDAADLVNAVLARSGR
jgi:hypothetical protein